MFVRFQKHGSFLLSQSMLKCRAEEIYRIPSIRNTQLELLFSRSYHDGTRSFFKSSILTSVPNQISCLCSRFSSLSTVNQISCGVISSSNNVYDWRVSRSSSTLSERRTKHDPGTDKNKEVNRSTKQLGKIASLKSTLQSVISLNAEDVINKKSKALAESEWDDWITVYRFRHIRFARVIQRLKLFQTALTCFLVLPGSFGCFLYGVIPFDYCIFSMFTSSFAAVMLYIMGTFCSRLVGVVYVSKSDPSLVRVAHMNFWGRREDKFYSKNDFIPFSELPDNVSDIYVNLKFYSEPETKLHFCVRYGTVYDKEEYEDIFGSYGSVHITEVSENRHKKE